MRTLLASAVNDGPRELVKVAADHVKLRNVEIKNGTGYACLMVQHDLDTPVEGFLLEGSAIHDCINERGEYRNGAYVEALCVSTTTARRMVIRDNDIYRCSGDGIQLHSRGNTQTPGLWRDVQIVGNRFYANDVEVNGEVYSPGEEAIDIKSGQGNVEIRGNVIWGFRSWSNELSAGGGSGSGSKGGAIVVHGHFVDCSLDRGDSCVIIEGNDISDSNVGIAVGTHTGTPFGVVIRRNVIHDLTADGSWDPENEARGSAIQLRVAQRVDVRHNTIVNTPGVGLHATGQQCQDCTFEYNILSRAGPGCGRKVGVGGVSVAGNYCKDVGSGSGTPPEHGCNFNLGSSQEIGFVSHPSSYQPPNCGEDPGQKPSETNYALAPGAHVLDMAGASTDVWHTCGGALDPGAYEWCSPFAPEALLVWNASARQVQVDAFDFYSVTSDFVSGVGAFANAMRFDSHALPNSGCGDDRTGTPVSNCLFFTQSCLNYCTPPRWENTEINCSCEGGRRTAHLGYFSPDAVSHTAIEMSLHTDEDGDGVFDYGSSGTNPRGSSAFMEFSRLSPFEAHLGWEDREEDLMTGDRDDYIASMRVFACTTRGGAQIDSTAFEFPIACRPDGQLCGTCDSVACNAPCDAAQGETLAVSMKLLADHADSAAALLEGRQIHLAVTVYNYSPTRRRFAACPEIEFAWNAQHVVPYRFGSLGTATCGFPVAAQAGRPDCGTAAHGRATFAMAQYQRPENATCNASDLVDDDAMEVAPARRCGNIVVPGMKTLNFILPMSWIDDPEGDFNILEVNQIPARLERLVVHLVQDLRSRRFACPSGLNARFAGLAPAIGTLARVEGPMAVVARGTP
jgi:hypothetical protein